VVDPQNPDTLYAAGAFGDPGRDGVFKSSDGGASWNAINSGLPARSGVHVLAIDPQNSRTVYAGSSGSGVFKSVDGGEGWSAVNSGLTTLSVNSLAIDPQDSSTVYAATAGGGVFVINVATIMFLC
jgi:photosystem II stability/assembly factor-like uncharacterized protein